MALTIRFNEEKNQLLKATRGVNFDDAVAAIEKGNVLVNVAHSSRVYKHQRIYILAINNYAYAVPYIINQKKREIFLKTMYASRVLTNRYIKKERL